MSKVYLAQVQRDAQNNICKTEYKGYSNLELCRIKEVDVQNKVVTAYFFDSKVTKTGVPYGLPFYNMGYGIIFVPTEGCFGIACWDKYRRPTILTFTGPSTVDKNNRCSRNLENLKQYNLPDLLEGEILIESVGHSFIKFDKLGGVMLSSAIFASINLDEDGNYKLDIETGEINVNGISKERYTENYLPSVEIVKGRHNYFYNKDSQDSVELGYRVSVFKDNKEVGFFGMDMEGNIRHSGKLIKEDFING